MHRELDLLYLSDRRHSHTLNYVYKCQNDLVPKHVVAQLDKVAHTHEVNTKAADHDDLKVPNFHLDMTRCSFWFQGPFYWNLTERHI